ncbi:hypothetical protein BU24DRAFT_427261 [Aaosphaeria arxii CBS 175.79]|uniref:CST complex subunit Ten1 n=1 Tax=Aaosphaeria arxii CBS 175.79 TaxID=1450172 RepID=A0A6A5XDG9_9PLEO|nr:uncharacterized protein BU24DRAFT_427261 [Aaosphaeria arxii CBS 175.79]KAF2011052.1 hypothetical protein BU24DRAFT_427261 [Aaosphaeria arxii CBS 175.79]
MSAAPIPSTLVLLSELGRCTAGQKVRFLGLVHEYTTSTATLTLKHDYPPDSPTKIAKVDITHVLESIKQTEIDVGTWLNVIGYVEHKKDQVVSVQAVTVWDALDVNVDAYEQAFEARRYTGSDCHS